MVPPAPAPEPDARERILAAAEEEFSAKGFAGARVAAIAGVAGVNKAMLYYYFGSKEGLYEAVFLRTFEAIASVAAQTMSAPSMDSARRVQGFIRGYRAVVLERPHFVRMMIRDLLDGGQTALRLLVPRFQPHLDQLREAYQQGMFRDVLQPGLDPAFIPLVLISPYVTFAAARPVIKELLGQDPIDHRAAFETTAERITLRGLLSQPSKEDSR